jgi:AcrR family transcriptional regulator
MVPSRRKPPSKAGGVDGRELRARRTREKIRRKAGDLIVARGLDNVTIQEIASAAGIAKGTFYLHFSGKQALVLEYAVSRLQRVAALLPNYLLMQSAREALHAIVTELIQGRKWHPELVKLVLLELTKEPEGLRTHDLRLLLQPLVELGVGRSQIRRDIPVDVLAGFVANTFYGGLLAWATGLADVDLDDAIDHAVTLAWDAIRAS